MSQDDLVIANQTFPATRTDLNSNFLALGTLMSGASAPGTIYAYMWWADTTNGVLKQRNAASDAWVIRDTLSDDRVVTKTTTYSVVAGDMKKTILCSASGAGFTITLLAAATAGDGFEVTFKKTDSTSNKVTLDGNAAETIDGAATITLDNQYESVTLICDGSNWNRKYSSPFTMSRAEITLASAGTTDLGSVTTNMIAISGTTGITAFGSSATLLNPVYFLRFTGALTITHNGTSLILPGSANITTANGDSCIALYLGSGNWKVLVYQKVDGTAIVGATGALTGITSVNGGELAGFRNFLYNPFFDVWQRGTSFTPAATTVTYLADRWFGYRSTDTAWTVSQQTAAAGYSQYGMKVQRNNGSSTTNQIRIGQVLPTIDVMKYAGKTCRLSLYLKAGANFSAASSQVTVDVKNGTGTDEGVASLIAATWTGSNTIFSTAQAITTTITRYDFACAIPANAKELAVQVLFTPVGTAGADDSFTIEAVQLEPGTVATPPEIRPFGIELALCQRFYAKTFAYSVAPAQNAGRLGCITGTGIGGGGNTQWMWRFPVVMRNSSQTITTYNPNVANANVRDFTAGSDVAVSVDPQSTKGDSSISIGSLISGQDVGGIHATAECEL